MVKELTKKGELFKYKNKSNNKISYINSYYGWEGKDTVGLFNYYTGYWDAAQILYKSIVKASKNREIEVTDTLVFPLIYLYRHSLELMIKYLYFKFCSKDDKTKKAFLQKGHKLIDLWEETKSYLKVQLEEQKSKIDLEIIENYIRKFNDCDSKSEKFRYPMDSKLNATHARSYVLDIEFLSETMDKLLNTMKKLDLEISNKISYLDEPILNIKKDLLINEITNNKEKIENYINILETEDFGIEYKDIKDYMKKRNIITPKQKYLQNEKYKTIVILCLMMLVGRDIEQGISKLSNNKKRSEDFIKLIMLIYKDENFDLNDTNQQKKVMNILLSKRSELVAEWLKISISEFKKLSN